MFLSNKICWHKTMKHPKKQTCLFFKTKEMLISPDFCDVCGISAEPLVLPQLPVRESYSIWQQLLKWSQEYLKHMSVFRLHGLLWEIINDLFERKSYSATPDCICSHHFYWKEHSWGWTTIVHKEILAILSAFFISISYFCIQTAPCC